MLIFPGDRVGLREAVAAGSGFPTARTGFLVELGPAGPPRLGSGWIFRG